MDREARDMRERRDVDTLGSLLGWPASLIPPALHGYPAGSNPIVLGMRTIGFPVGRHRFSAA
jgi:hypothetical protein